MFLSLHRTRGRRNEATSGPQDMSGWQPSPLYLPLGEERIPSA